MKFAMRMDILGFPIVHECDACALGTKHFRRLEISRFGVWDASLNWII